MVEVPDSPSILFDGMAGSRMPVVVSHGEGYADFSQGGDPVQVIGALRYVDNHGRVTETYPANPNGSPGGLTGVTTADGRFTLLMPHPERVFRAVQHSWHPDDWREDGPWLRMFRNARKCGGISMTDTPKTIPIKRYSAEELAARDREMALDDTRWYSEEELDELEERTPLLAARIAQRQARLEKLRPYQASGAAPPLTEAALVQVLERSSRYPAA